MQCKNCGKNLNQEDKSCSNCETKNDRKKFDHLWIACTIGLVILSFVVLFYGIVTGIGSGYNNSDSSFDFEPFGIAFVGINGINILFNIIMFFISKKRNN